MNAVLRPAPLQHLSLQRCARGKVPPVPSNEDRRRAFLAVQPIFTPVELNNFTPWPHLRSKEEPCPQ